MVFYYLGGQVDNKVNIALRDREGCLNGLTILRFAHAFKTGGGTERYLDDLDNSLLVRNRMRIIRLYVAREKEELLVRVNRVGRGELVFVGLPLSEGDSLQSSYDEPRRIIRVKEWFRNRVIYNPLVWRLFAEKYLLNRKIPRRPGQVVGAGAKVAELIDRYGIDFIVLHFMGGSDTDEIVEVAVRKRVPFVVINHYSNDRFLHLSIRKHAILADGVGSVNGVGIPRYLQTRLYNVSDGIDIEYYKREKAKQINFRTNAPIIFLSARIVKVKGHLDLIRAGNILKEHGIDFIIAFAGRVDSSSFENDLRREIQKNGLKDKVLFLGLLDQEELRDWYAASSVIAFPTYHHEGLGRILLESQAMKVPPVAYATGGVPEGLQDGKTGFLVKTGDVKGLAEKIELLIRNRELREKMGEDGRRFVEDRFSLEALAKRHEDFYLRVLAHKKAKELTE